MADQYDVPPAEWRVTEWNTVVSSREYLDQNADARSVMISPERKITFDILVNTNAAEDRRGFLGNFRRLKLTPADFDRPVEEVAREKNGCHLVYQVAFDFNDATSIVHRIMQNYGLQCGR